MNTKNYYLNIVLYEFLMKLNLKNIMELPKIEKIVLNIGYPRIAQDKKQILSGLLALELVSGQQAYATQSSKQIHSLKIRKKMYVGCAVTLRSTNMYFFLDKFVTLIFSNFRNFSGFPISYDTYNRHVTFRIKDLYVFPELEKEYHLFQKIDSIDITIVFEDKPIFKKVPNLAILLLQALQIPTEERKARK